MSQRLLQRVLIAFAAVWIVATIVLLVVFHTDDNGSGTGTEDPDQRCRRITAVLDDPTGPEPSADDAAWWLNHCDASLGGDGGYVE